MKQYEFKVELLKKINNEYKIVETEYVYEFDDDCTNANVFYKASDLFKNKYDANDIIRTHVFSSTQSIMKKIIENEEHFILV